MNRSARSSAGSLPSRRRRALVLGAPAVLAGVAKPVRAAASPLRMGMSSPFTGEAGAYGAQMKQGIEMAFSAANQRGGVHGQRLELVTLDDGYEAGPAVANTRRLVRGEGAFALMGFYGTASSLAVMPVLDELDVPLIGTISGAQALRAPANRHLFHLRASYDDETAAIVRHLALLGMSRIAVFYQDDGFGLAGLQGVKEALAALKLAPVAVGSVPRNSIDVRRAVEAMAPLRPQAVVMATLYRPSAEFIKGLRAAGAASAFVALSPVGTDKLVAELGPEHARGVQVSQVIPSPWSDKLKAAREYKRTLAEQAPDAAISYYGFEGYLNARLVLAALDRAGAAPTRERLVAALHAAPFDIGGYVVDFHGASTAGSHYAELSVIGAEGRILT